MSQQSPVQPPKLSEIQNHFWQTAGNVCLAQRIHMLMGLYVTACVAGNYFEDIQKAVFDQYKQLPGDFKGEIVVPTGIPTPEQRAAHFKDELIIEMALTQCHARIDMLNNALVNGASLKDAKNLLVNSICDHLDDFKMPLSAQIEKVITKNTPMATPQEQQNHFRLGRKNCLKAETMLAAADDLIGVLTQTDRFEQKNVIAHRIARMRDKMEHAQSFDSLQDVIVPDQHMGDTEVTSMNLMDVHKRLNVVDHAFCVSKGKGYEVFKKVLYARMQKQINS